MGQHRSTMKFWCWRSDTGSNLHFLPRASSKNPVVLAKISNGRLWHFSDNFHMPCCNAYAFFIKKNNRRPRFFFFFFAETCHKQTNLTRSNSYHPIRLDEQKKMTDRIIVPGILWKLMLKKRVSKTVQCFHLGYHITSGIIENGSGFIFD